jgi:hypothetical protein
MQHSHKFSNPKSIRGKKQGGFALLSALLALVVIGFITSSNIISQQLATELTAGSLQGELLTNVARGANKYTMENYGLLQKGMAVSKNGITLAVGSDVGQSMSPTVDNLIAMGYLNTGTTEQSRLGNAKYQVILERIPAGCVDTACKIPGRVYIDKPIRKPGSTDMAGLQVGAIMDKVGSDVLVSLDGTPTILNSPTGATFANPVTGTPVGVVAHRIGFGASIFDDFLIVNDPRDPNFQGNFTVAGNSTFNSSVTINGPATVAGPISAIDTLSGCIRAGMLPGAPAGGGSAFVTNTACLKTVNLDTVTALGSIEVKNASGIVVATLNPDGTIVANTRTIAPASKVTSGFVPNTACNAAAANDIAQNASTPGLVVCRNNIWTPIGLTISSVGSVCSVEGAAGVTMTGLGLFCQGGIWIANADRIGHFSTQDTFIGHHNMLVDKPFCPSNGIQRINFNPTGAEFSPAVGIRSTYFVTEDLGPRWRLKIIDANNIAVPDGQGLVTTGCWFN